MSFSTKVSAFHLGRVPPVTRVFDFYAFRGPVTFDKSPSFWHTPILPMFGKRTRHRQLPNA